MTIEECALEIVEEVEQALGSTFADRALAVESLSVKLRALIYIESERTADLVKNYGWPEQYDDHRDCLVRDILATSPGKVGG